MPTSPNNMALLRPNVEVGTTSPYRTRQKQENRMRIEYDQPSSLPAVCDSVEVKQIAQDLDRKLRLVVEHTVERAVGNR
jgi:hypothetical protein